MINAQAKSLKVKEGNGHLEGARGGGVGARSSAASRGCSRRGRQAEDEEEGSDPEAEPWRQRCRPWACTMEMFSMLKHSVGSEDVNPITKHYIVGKQTGSAGVEMVWKIYEAVRTEDKKVSPRFCWFFIEREGGARRACSITITGIITTCTVATNITTTTSIYYKHHYHRKHHYHH